MSSAIAPCAARARHTHALHRPYRTSSILLFSMIALTLAAPLATASLANIYNYIGAITAADSTVFAATTSLYNSVGGIQSDSTVTYGPRVLLQDNSAPQQGLLTQDTNFRMDTLAEIFVALTALHLDSIGMLPYGLDLPLPPSVLPPFFENATFLHNSAYPMVPITLRLLLEHVSTLSETGFMEAASETPVSEPLPTLETFVDNLFNTYGNEVFLSGREPGVSSSFYFSRTNIALATYVINTQLALMQADVPADQRLDMAGYLMDRLLPRLGMASTFVLTPYGNRSNTAFPPHLTVNWLPYLAMQDVNRAGDAAMSSITIHPAYSADYMFYTSTSDLIKLVAGVLIPGGVFYDAVGPALIDRAVKVVNAAAPYLSHRGLGLYNMSYSELCDAMVQVAQQVGAQMPICSYPADTVPSDTAAYGILSSGAHNQIAMLCFPTINQQPWCSASSVAYFQNMSNMLSTRLGAGSVAGSYDPSNPPGVFNNWALLLSTASLAEYTTYVETPSPTPTTTKKPAPVKTNKNFGLWVFLGVLATFVMVVAGSYVTDYFIQPAPPAKIVVPVPVVPTGAAAVGREGDGGVGGVSTGPALAVESGPRDYPPALAGPDGFHIVPGAFDRSEGLQPTRLSLLDDDDDDAHTTTTTTTTGTTTTSTTHTRNSTSTTTVSSTGTSPEGMRYRLNAHRHRERCDKYAEAKERKSCSPEIASSSNSPSAAEDRSTSSSRGPDRGGGNGGGGRGGSREFPRFDAYI